MKVRSRGKLWLAGVLAVLLAGGAVLLWQGKGAGMAATVDVVEPDSKDLTDFAATRVFFGHQSVGANVISGVAPTFEAAGRSAPVVVETRDRQPGGAGFLAHAPVGVNGDPLGKFDDFVKVLDGPLGEQVDVALVKLCYVDVVAGTDVEALFSAYSTTMAKLESKHPDVRFVYTTVPLTTDRGWKATVKSWIGQDDQMGPADNLARQRYNELVRARYGASGRLFDIAAVEATMAGSPTRRHSDAQEYFVLNGALAADPGHLNDLGSRAAAAELIRVVAGLGR